MKELERIRKLIQNANDRIDISVEDLLSDDEENDDVEQKNNEIKMTRKKKKQNTSQV